MDIIYIEPYYSGSQKRWIDSYKKHSKHNITIVQLRGNKWTQELSDKGILNTQVVQTVGSSGFGQNLNIEAQIVNIEVSNESIYTHANLDKSKTMLGYNPKISFKEGIKEFLDWHKTYE